MSEKNKEESNSKEPEVKNQEFPGIMNIPHTIGSAVIKPEDMGRIRGQAMIAMREQTSRQMSQLYEQMKVLVNQANEIKKRVEISEKIYAAQTGFEPVIGQSYYVYEKAEGAHVLSLISPGEWGNKLPYKQHIATVKLLADHTWDVVDSTGRI